MTTYYRNVIEVEILSDSPWKGEEIYNLSAVNYAITDGDSSGIVAWTTTNEELTAQQMAAALRDQGSDPSLLGIEDEE